MDGFDFFIGAAAVILIAYLAMKHGSVAKGVVAFGTWDYGDGEPNLKQQDTRRTTLLWLFFGILGGHRFYTGHYGTGFLMLITLGGFFLWWILDFFALDRLIKRRRARRNLPVVRAI